MLAQRKTLFCKNKALFVAWRKWFRKRNTSKSQKKNNWFIEETQAKHNTNTKVFYVPIMLRLCLHLCILLRAYVFFFSVFYVFFLCRLKNKALFVHFSTK